MSSLTMGKIVFMVRQGEYGPMIAVDDKGNMWSGGIYSDNTHGRRFVWTFLRQEINT